MKYLGAGVGLALVLPLILATSYILSWPILDTLKGSDSAFHRTLVEWVSGSFPSLNWWYRWDLTGVSYREGYPLLAHWITVLVAHLAHIDNTGAMQWCMFAISPLCALGIYLFASLRWNQPLVGIIAAFFYLLSPLSWTFLVDWGFYANSFGTVLIMPALIFLDIVHKRFLQGDWGRKLRISLIIFLLLTALLGWASPSLLAIPLIFAFLLVMSGGGVKWVGVVFVMALAVGFLDAFWALPLQGYLGVVNSRAPAPTYSASLFHLWNIPQILGLNGLGQGGGSVYDRAQISVAIWLWGLLGLLAWKANPWVRVLLGVALYGVVSMVFEPLYFVLYNLPLALNFFSFRAGTVLLQFAVPLLAGIGIAQVPQVLLSLNSKIPLKIKAVSVLILQILFIVLAGIGVGTNAHTVAARSNAISYGDFRLDSRDIWNTHKQDECVVARKGACLDPNLTKEYNLNELRTACRKIDGAQRTDLAICTEVAAMEEGASKAVSSGVLNDFALWCTHNSDKACDARFMSLSDQILNISNWRHISLGCLSQCPTYSPPNLNLPVTQRAILDAHTDPLFKEYHLVNKGSQFYGYNYQLAPSPELDNFAHDTLLNSGNVAAKNNLTQYLGADLVILSGDQLGALKDYQSIGWTGNGGILSPPGMVSLASLREDNHGVMVIGRTPSSTNEAYNQVFQAADEGMLPYQKGWLYRGNSPYVDDYSDEELRQAKTLILFGYNYHDQANAYAKIDKFVKEGGSLFIETGWQFVNPDWELKNIPSWLPLERGAWQKLSGSTPIPNSDQILKYNPFVYGTEGYGADVATKLKSGAKEELKVGDKIVAARMDYGKGHVFWSGANVISHALSNGKAQNDEWAFLEGEMNYLLGDASSVQELKIAWIGEDSAKINIEGGGMVLFKEAFVPGWKATLESNNTSIPLSIESAGLDFMMVRIPPHSSGVLIFHFYPSNNSYLGMILTLMTLFALGIFLFKPILFKRPISHWANKAHEKVNSWWSNEDEE